MRLLIIGNLDGQLIPASKIAQKNGAKVNHSPDIESAITTLCNGKIVDLIFIDIEQDIKTFINSLQAQKFSIPVIACGVKHDAKRAVEAIEHGAKDYLPLPPQEDLIAAIFESIASSDSVSMSKGKSKKFEEVLGIIKKIAPSEATVLITGESGTGKEVVAKMIHDQSKRVKNEFVSVNCAAIPENLLESELFGHEKGAFTGATERRIGKFEAANGSTLLLDEISEMDPKLQAKLLRVLQEKEVTRLGGNNTIKLDVRVIATSNRDMISDVKNGKFREDLFYRLNVISISLPALRQRLDDIEELAEFFVHKYSKLNAVEEKLLTVEAKHKLVSYEWPGNIRELENTIHRAILLSADKEIKEHDIMLLSEHANSNQSMRTLEEIEGDAISTTMHHTQGDELKAAMILGISVRALKDKLKKFKKVGNA